MPSKSGRHHNRSGRSQTKSGKAKERMKSLAKKLNIPYGRRPSTPPAEDVVSKVNALQFPEWDEKWARTQAAHSERDLDNWREVTKLLVEGRKEKNRKNFQPIGYTPNDHDASTYLVERNNRGIALEKKKDEVSVEAAMIIYEMSIADIFWGTHPYDRLRILYTKRKWYKDAMRVCKAFIALIDPEERLTESKAHFAHHLNRLREKEARANKAKQSLVS